MMRLITIGGCYLPRGYSEKKMFMDKLKLKIRAFAIDQATATRSDGKNHLDLSLIIFRDDNVAMIEDRIQTNEFTKLESFAGSVGVLEDYKKGIFDLEDLVGRSGLINLLGDNDSARSGCFEYIPRWSGYDSSKPCNM